MFIGIFFILFYPFKSSHNQKVSGSNPLPDAKQVPAYNKAGFFIDFSGGPLSVRAADVKVACIVPSVGMAEGKGQGTEDRIEPITLQQSAF